MPVQPDILEIKEEARGLLRTSRVPPLRFTLLLLAVELGLSLVDAAVTGLTARGGTGPLPFSVSFADILISLLNTVLLAGFANYCLRVRDGAEMPYESLFDAFPFAGRVILLDVLEGLLIALASILFLIPGLILALSYSLALFHLCEEPDAGVIEALRRSRREMNGHRWQMLRLIASFWPQLLLVGAALFVCESVLGGLFPDTFAGNLLYVLTSGAVTAAARVYPMPYLELAQAGFYRRVTAGRDEEAY